MLIIFTHLKRIMLIVIDDRSQLTDYNIAFQTPLLLSFLQSFVFLVRYCYLSVFIPINCAFIQINEAHHPFMELAYNVPGNLSLLSIQGNTMEYQYTLDLGEFTFDSERYLALDGVISSSFLPEVLQFPLLFNVYLRVLDVTGKDLQNVMLFLK